MAVCEIGSEKVNVECGGSRDIDLFHFFFPDVDECSPVSDCMHICENTFGGYNCKCNSDFKVDDTDSKKCVRKYILAN